MAKSIIIIYFENLLPADTGSKSNTFNLLKTLKEKGFEITLFCCYTDTANHPEISKYVDKLIEIKNPLSNWLYKIANRIFNFLVKNPIRQNIVLKLILRRMLKDQFVKHDYILFNYVIFSEIIPDELFAKSILFTHDIVYYRYQQWYNQNGDMNALVEAVKTKELSQLNKFWKVLVVADYEERLLELEGFDSTKVYNIGAPQEITDLVYKNFPYYFGFLGGKYEQNVVALKKFLLEYYVHCSDKTLAIGGGIGSVPEIKELIKDFPNIKVLGFVDDLESFYDNVRFIVATLPMGSGIKIKVVEAMSYGKIVIGTDKAFEGVNPVHLTHVVDVQKLSSATALIEVLRNYEALEAYEKMSADAKSLIRENFSYEKLFNPLIESIK